MTAPRSEAATAVRSRGRAVDRKGKTAVRALVVAFAAVLIVAVGQGLWSATRTTEDHSQMLMVATRLPTEIAGVKLVHAETGPAALQAVGDLHGLDVGVSEAEIGEYGTGAVVWIGVALDAGRAAELVDRMTSRILAGSPSFSHQGEVSIRGLKVHQVGGGGQQHIYYQKGNEVIWVSASPGAGEAFMSRAVERIP